MGTKEELWHQGKWWEPSEMIAAARLEGFNEAKEQAAKAVRDKRESWSKEWRDACEGKDINSTNYADILKVAEDVIAAMQPEAKR